MGKINSRAKGARGEREFANDVLKELWGLQDARRGQQFSGSPDSPDVLGLPGVHFEVKRVERLNLAAAQKQAVDDAGFENVPVIAHRYNHGDWWLMVRAKDAATMAIHLLVAQGYRVLMEKESEADQ